MYTEKWSGLARPAQLPNPPSYTHSHVYTYTHTYTYVYTHIHTCIPIHTCTYLHPHARTHPCTHMYKHTSIHPPTPTACLTPAHILLLTILLRGDLTSWTRFNISVVLYKPLGGLYPPGTLQILGVDLVCLALLGLWDGTLTRSIVIGTLAVPTEHMLRMVEVG